MDQLLKKKRIPHKGLNFYKVKTQNPKKCHQRQKMLVNEKEFFVFLHTCDIVVNQCHMTLTP